MLVAALTAPPCEEQKHEEFEKKGNTRSSKHLAGLVDLLYKPGFPSTMYVSSAMRYCYPFEVDSRVFVPMGLDNARTVHVAAFASVKSDTSNQCRFGGRFRSVKIT